MRRHGEALDRQRSIERILVVKTEGGVGDLLMSTPLLTTLRHHFPEASISVMVKPSCAEIMQGNPDIQEVIRLQPKELTLRSLVRFLQDRRFHLAMVLWGTAQLAWGLFLAGIPYRVGEGGRLTYSFLYTHEVRRRRYIEGSDESHQVEQMLDYARILGLRPAHDGLVIGVSPETTERVRGILLAAGVRLKDERKDEREEGGEARAEESARRSPVVGLHIAKGIEKKERWPVRIFAELADALIDSWGSTVILTGGSDEVELVEKMIGMMKHRNRVREPVAVSSGAGSEASRGMTVAAESASGLPGRSGGSSGGAVATDSSVDWPERRIPGAEAGGGAGGEGSKISKIPPRVGLTKEGPKIPAQEGQALNFAGKTTMKELTALTALCDLFICPDSGPMHMAAAMKTPTVGIFALESDYPYRWRPYGTRYEIVRNPFLPRPACKKEECHDFLCLQQIPLSAILPAVEKLLGPKRAGEGTGGVPSQSIFDPLRGSSS